MRRFKILALQVCGNGNHVFNGGEIVRYRQLDNRNIHKLIEGKYIEPYLPLEELTIVFVTMIYRRHDIFHVWAKNMNKLKESTPANIHVIVAGSEQEKSKDLVESYGFEYLETENSPLSNKANATTLAAKKHEPDFVICLGSDDIITPNLFSLYAEKMKEGFEFIGLRDFYFLNWATGECKYWGGYEGKREGKTIGAGRAISFEVIEQMGWQPWGPDIDSKLDNSMDIKLRSIGPRACVLSLKETGTFAVDIKTENNITPWERLTGIPANFDRSILL